MVSNSDLHNKMQSGPDLMSKPKNIAAEEKKAYMCLAHTCIGPADLACSGVVGQSIGKSNAILYQDSSVLSIHRGALDFRSFSVPVSPVQGSVKRSSFTCQDIMAMVELLVDFCLVLSN